MSTDLPPLLTWKVYIHYREPTYAAYRGHAPRDPYVASFVLEAPGEDAARERAVAHFKALYRYSGVGWVREIEAVTVRLVDPAATLH
ncbi:MAG: hypothetical protein D6729_13360 [Deltaproteobacteria bacterium]|nr:MAG: hypothetical protein D6729_13360 [Deltaproteobacteria bacterium]